MIPKAKDHFDNIDILVNNAMVGRYFLKPFLDSKWDDFSEKFYDEMKAAYEVTRAMLPAMIKKSLLKNCLYCYGECQVS